jgi:hypothetical protein
MSFPVYLLRLGKSWQVIFPENKSDIGHTDFWEKTVSKIVAEHYHIPHTELVNLPYCQRRARVVASKIYTGSRNLKPELQTVILIALRKRKLQFLYDEHEKRLREDVMQFRRLTRRYRPKSTST